jgi:hypothetical protein
MSYTIASFLRNGPIVGGANDHVSTGRSQLTMYATLSYATVSPIASDCEAA